MAADFVLRETLEQRLDTGCRFPLTLISAPAGYGKSSLVGHWLADCDYPNAWLSLDDTHNTLSGFLNYFIAAIQKISPNLCQETMSVLQSGELPPPGILAGILCNDLDDIEERSILALDDYYRIRLPEIHEFLENVLHHPPRNLHLVIITRWDPPFSLARLRGKQLMTEIRLQDLRFGETETATFFEQALGRSIDHQEAKALMSKTEGWPIATRLAIEALRNRSDVAGFIHAFGGDSLQLQDYLVTEILAQQPEEVRDCLVRTSILDRFSAPLCEDLCGHRCGTDSCVLRQRPAGRSFWDIGLLCIPLDPRAEWFRFHHLLQDLLRQRLTNMLDPEEISELHRRSARWFEERGLIEEALAHLLKSGEIHGAGQLVARKKDQILNEEWWPRLEQFLDWLPPEVVENSPELLLLKAYLLQNRCRWSDSRQLFDRIELLLDAGPSGAERTDRSRASLHSLRSLEAYVAGSSRQALEYARKAVLHLSPDCYLERGKATIVLALALQMTGDLKQARKVVYRELGQSTEKGPSTYQSHLLAALGFVDWIAADLSSLRRCGKQMANLGDNLQMAESSEVGRYFVGVADYEQNRLSAAREGLLPVVSNRLVANLEFFSQAVMVLASVCEAEGKSKEAHQLIESLAERMLRIGNMTVFGLAQDFQAELALRQGALATALKWTEEFNPPPLTPMYRFHSPHLTLAKILVRVDDRVSRRKAEVLLTQLEQYLTQTHNRRFLAETLAVQALFLQKKGRGLESRSALGKALSLARSGTLIRIFVDLGPEILELLRAFDSYDEETEFVEEILSAFDAVQNAEAVAGREIQRPSQEESPLVEPLTNREAEILELLSKRMSNKEIAERLCISPATVKRHAENLYGKLGSRGRREAVITARQLGILRT